MIAEYCSIIIDNIVLISRALRHQFIIPEFESFTSHIDDFFETAKSITEGKVKTTYSSWGRSVLDLKVIDADTDADADTESSQMEV